MPVFISYSHADKTFVDKLAATLVRNRAHVWVDTWELNVGDSIIQRVQDALTEASALLVILSKASVESDWCRKELNAGLMRELSEKKVIVLPVLLEDCTIPLFLREKMYADFRTSFDDGLRKLLDGVSAVTNADQSRIDDAGGSLDWGVDWRYENGLFQIRFTIVQCPKNLEMTFLTEIEVFCNEAATCRYKQYEQAGLDWVGRAVIAEFLHDFADKAQPTVVLADTQPVIVGGTSKDNGGEAAFDVVISSRKLGNDNGKDQLIHVSEYLRMIRGYMRQVSRPPTAEEMQRVREIQRTPFGA